MSRTRTETKTAVAIGLVACLLAMGGRPARSADTAPPEPPHERESADAAVTLRGEVVDLHCYLTRGASGPEHAGCGNACLARGVTPGFLAEDGRVFLLLASRPFSVKDEVAGLAGEKVTLTGTLVERAGLHALKLESVARAAR
jgi:hypothetical protein